MKSTIKLSLIASLVLGLAACNSDGSSSPSTGLNPERPVTTNPKDYTADDVDGLQAAKDKIGQEIDQLTKTKMALNNEIDDLNKQLGEVDLEITEKEAEIINLGGSLARSTLEEIQQQIEGLQKEVAELKIKRAEITKSLNQKQEELGKVTENLNNSQMTFDSLDAKYTTSLEVRKKKQFDFERDGMMDDGDYHDEPNAETKNFQLYGTDKNGKAIEKGFKDLTQLKQGINTIGYSNDVVGYKNGTTSKDTGNFYIYNQEYSAIIADSMLTSKIYDKNGKLIDNESYVEMGFSYMTGLNTTAADVAKLNGTATYKGQAFAAVSSGLQAGSLEYTINFAGANQGTGQGKITGLGNAITLENANLNQEYKVKNHHFKGLEGGVAISGVASSKDFQNGSYTLGVFGPKAEEINGVVYRGEIDQDIIFGGKQTNFKEQ